MPRPKKHREGLGKPVSFRLSETDFLAYQEKVQASGLTSADFFRNCILTNRTQIVAKPQVSVDRSRLLYLISKASNNINQLAYRANSDHLTGLLSDATYKAILSELDLIARYLKIALNQVE